MDVKYMFKRINYVENVANSVLEDHQLKIIHLNTNLTLKDAEAARKNYKFYEKLEKFYYEF